MNNISLKIVVRKWFKKKSNTCFYLWYVGYYFIGYTTGIKYILQ